MNDKEKQIEEIVEVMGEWATEYKMCWNSEHATSLAKWLLGWSIGQGYRKIDKDSVVFLREEWECLHNDYAKALYNARQQTRKETAREILTEIQTEIFHCLGVKNIKETDKLSVLGSLITYDLITDKLYELSKQYGVEIGE